MAKSTKAAVKQSAPQVRPQAKVKTAVDESEGTGTALAIPKISAKAMSKDVGVALIRDLAATDADTEKGKAMLAAATTKRYDLQSKLTLAIVKAATNEASINLSHAFSDDKKAQGLLNNQLGVALGYREIAALPNGKTTVQYVKEVYPYFPSPGEDRDTVEYKKKQTTRSGFLHRLKQCCMVANGIIADKTKAEIDKESGVLKLTGPAVKKQFGTSSVLLNEKQTITDSKGTETKLIEKPSFTAIAARAAEAHGKIINRVSNTRGAGPGGFAGASPEKVVIAGADAMIAALAKIRDVTDAMKDKLRALVTACNAKLA